LQETLTPHKWASYGATMLLPHRVTEFGGNRVRCGGILEGAVFPPIGIWISDGSSANAGVMAGLVINGTALQQLYADALSAQVLLL